MQYREVHARQGHGDHGPPAAPRVLAYRLQEHRVACGVHVAQVRRLHVGNAPVGRLLLALQRDLQQRAAKQFEALARQRRERRVLDDAKEHMQRERVHRARNFLERPDQAVELCQRGGLHALALQAQNGVHAGRHAVAARLGQQRAVVAHAEVAIGATQVGDLAPLATGRGIFGDELVGGDDLERRVIPAEVGELLDNDHLF
ncbi:hypothetical protein D3C86_1651730 [compost metagenome]